VSVRGFRAALRAPMVTQWLSDRPGLRVGFQVLWTFAGWCDKGMQAAVEGVRAGWPGSDTRVDNLRLLGFSRQRIQGETETDPEFVVTLQNWLVDVRDMGGDVWLVKELHRWIAGNPMVRLISRTRPASPLNRAGGALYTTCATDGTVTQTYAAWNWDAMSNPERQGQKPGDVGFFDYWIVVYAPTASLYESTTGHWGDGQGPGNSGRGLGLSATIIETSTIRNLVATGLGAHVTCRTLIWSYDVAAFDPATPARSGNPDGTWGRWFNAATCLASRNRTHRYTSIGPERL
jgi:hypothetical protein